MPDAYEYKLTNITRTEDLEPGKHFIGIGREFWPVVASNDYVSMIAPTNGGGYVIEPHLQAGVQVYERVLRTPREWPVRVTESGVFMVNEPARFAYYEVPEGKYKLVEILEDAASKT